MDFVFRTDHAAPPTATLVGPMSTAHIVTLEPATRLFGVRFRPGIAALFADASAHELLDGDAELEGVIGARARTLLARIRLAGTDPARVEVMKHFLLAGLV